MLPKQQVWDGQQALQLVRLEKRKEPLVRQCPLCLTGATAAESGCVVVSSIESRDVAGGAEGSARHNWNHLLPAGGTWSREQLGKAAPLTEGGVEELRQQPFLLHRQVMRNCCLQSADGQLCRRGFHQSAPSVCNLALCNGKKRRRGQTLISHCSSGPWKRTLIASV